MRSGEWRRRYESHLPYSIFREFVKASGGRSLTRFVSRRPPISLYMRVPRTGGYAYDVGVWGLSIVQGPFSVAPVPNPRVTIRSFCVAVPCAVRKDT
jgi:hypothetical protein